MRFILILVAVLVSISSSISANELRDRQEVSHNAAQLFWTKQFHELEAFNQDLLLSDARSSSGLAKIHLSTTGLYDSIPLTYTDDVYWDSHYDIAEEWLKLYPSSSHAPVVRAIIRFKHAQSFLRPGHKLKLTPPNPEEFKKRVLKLLEDMADEPASVEENPEWFWIKLFIMRQVMVPEDEFFAVYENAVTRHPYHYQLYFEAASYINRIHTDFLERLESLAQEAASRTKERDSDGAYTRVYWFTIGDLAGSAAIYSKHMDWDKMKRGMEDILKDYPDEWNIQNFARIACYSADGPTTTKMMKRIKTDPIQHVWRHSVDFERCNSIAPHITREMTMQAIKEASDKDE